MTVKLLVDYTFGGRKYLAGNLLTADAGTETGLVAAKLADSTLTGGTAYVAPPPVPWVADAKFLYPGNGGSPSLVDGAGNAFLRGALASGEWSTIPSIFRLRLTGTGTVVMDSRDSLGVEALVVESYAVSGATDQIEYPYAGDNAVAIRITLTGTATAEVI